MFDSIFGTQVVERSLLYIVNYGEGHINGIAKTFGYSPSQVQVQLDKLENDGVLVSKRIGNIRSFQVNPRLKIKAELVALLEKMLMSMPKKELERYYRDRQRPRRKGKEL